MVQLSRFMLLVMFMPLNPLMMHSNTVSVSRYISRLSSLSTAGLTLEGGEAGGGSGEVVPHLVDQVVVVLDPVLLRLHHRGLTLNRHNIDRVRTSLSDSDLERGLQLPVFLLQLAHLLTHLLVQSLDVQAALVSLAHLEMVI